MQTTASYSSRLKSRLGEIRLALKSYAFRFFLSSALILILIGLVIFVSLFTYITVQQGAEIRNSLKSELERAQAIYAEGGVEAFERETTHALVEYNLTNFYYLLVDSEGNTLAGDLQAWPEDAQRKDDRLVFSVQRHRGTSPVIKLTAMEATLPDGSRLLVARNLRLLGLLIQNYSFVVLLFFSVSVVLCLGLALIFSILSLTRLEKFNIGIRRIMRGNLSERFATSDSKAEPEELARNLNSMLDVITSLMEDVKRVSDNIAHDLRTPLTRHRNNLVSVKNRLGEAEAEAVEDLIVETDQLLATFNSLLRIARIESGNRTSTLAPMQLASLVQDVAELYEPLAADKNVTIDVALADRATIVGDRNLLFQAIANLIDNAIKFTPGNGHIGVKLYTGRIGSGTAVLEAIPVRGRDEPSTTGEHATRRNRSCATLEIADSGQGVNPDNYNKMFQRFYREEQSRGQQPGNGLGLSMVYATMKLHNGTILVEDNNPGLVIKLVFNYVKS